MENGRLLKELRLKKGMTQEELADKTEVSARTIQRIENGEVDPRAYTLQMIAKALDVDFSLFTQDDLNHNGNTQKVDDRKWLGLLHLSGLLPLFIPSLIIWKLKKYETTGIAIHFQAVISIQLCILGITLAGLWIYWKVNQPTPFIAGLLAGGLLSIINAIKVMNGFSFINPFIRDQGTAQS